MLLPQGLIPDRERVFVEWVGIAVAALGVINQRQVVETSGYQWVLWPKRLIADCQGALVERLGLGVLSLGVVERR